MDGLCDLHIHSLFSDGSWSPSRIIAEAGRKNLRCVALTDHNTIDGVPEFLAAAKRAGIPAVPGVEISTDYGDRELHILGLFLPESHFAEIKAFLEQNIREKERCNRQLLSALNRIGYEIDYDELLRCHPQGSINRATIAQAMVEKGYAASVAEVFRGLLSKKQPYYVCPRRIPAMEAIAFLKQIGAAPILAHPFLDLEEPALRCFLKEAIPAGLVGMETRYARYSPETTALSTKIAGDFSLLESGGSDFHGSVKPDIALGCGTGNLEVPATFAQAIAEKCHISLFEKEEDPCC